MTLARHLELGDITADPPRLDGALPASSDESVSDRDARPNDYQQRPVRDLDRLNKTITALGTNLAPETRS